ncbi:hypothetical protein LSH36_1310g00000 [Paralvinella palmiformis]|uniref:Uncharacterized protein n=1 Tax=Paralvinella palmiformis TaxID=53620 RepID=A0AAD9IT99_9ANNE|nr:hypothetical protein LSH36_1310g00000 [Paralvinella palmiformis]
MIKNCINKVDLKIAHMGVVQERQCEYALGMGPETHYKHVAAGYVYFDHAMIEERRKSIQKKRCGQSSYKLWKEEWLLRLQALRFDGIRMATDKTDCPKLAASFRTGN